MKDNTNRSMLTVAIGVILFLILQTSGVAKLVDHSARTYAFDRGMLRWVATLEIVIGVLLVTRYWRVGAGAGAILALAMLVDGFVHHSNKPCGCFGNFIEIDRAERQMLAGTIGALCLVMFVVENRPRGAAFGAPCGDDNR